MKRFYFFVHDTQCTLATQFFKVAIGTSAADQSIKLKLEVLSKSIPDFYFKLYDEEARTFLDRIADSFGVSHSQLQIHQITARDAFKLVPNRHVKNLSTYSINF